MISRCLPAYFDDYITDAILEHTQGNADKLDISALASSVQELAEMKAKKQEDLTNQARIERDRVSNQLEMQTKTIIDGAVERTKKKLGISRMWLLLISLWTIIAPLVFVGINAVISLLANTWRIVIGATAIVLVFCVVEYTKRVVSTQLLLKAVPMIEKTIKKRIAKNLGPAELQYNIRKG